MTNTLCTKWQCDAELRPLKKSSSETGGRPPRLSPKPALERLDVTHSSLHEGAATARWWSSKTRQTRIQFRHTAGVQGLTVDLRDLRALGPTTPTERSTISSGRRYYI